ncbi:FAD-dependent oxidoreductase [Pacificimonas sp. WHA3]|uniref:Thioredoxin reductase n=1 Tax=Pacificimonas pallii TaxID=2827236 RepID=A0ABS6SIC1_9SPHN|nr:cyclic nucleotide-binding domain-containing thioredoxin-disulfide reductase [Pacificimonas pallii]MBV7257612.1 FAD-dependent oxidoreductase [Pacificimonas pallii]
MEQLAIDLNTTPRQPLAEAHVRAIRKIAASRRYPAGTIIVRPGDPMDEFVFIDDGEIEVVDVSTGERTLPHTLGPGQYIGEIAFLNGGSWTMCMRAALDTDTLVVPRQEMLDLMARIPELSDSVVTVFAGRRRRVFEDEKSSLTLVGGDDDRAIRRIAAFADRNRVPVTRLDLGTSQADALLRSAGLPLDRPAVLFGAEAVDDPNPRAIARLLGLDLSLSCAEHFDTVIVGGGPAGIAAAVYAGAEGLSALVIEDQVIGGQAGSSSRIENYMGFPTGISGADLCWRGEIQAMRLGTRFIMPRRVTTVAPCDAGYCLTLDDGETVNARTVVVASGVQYRRLPIERFKDFEGAGIYYAATEIEARYCRNSEVVIVGGGNSAGQAAMFLSRVASHVHVLVRGEGLADSMSSYLSNRLYADPDITVHPHAELSSLYGDGVLDAVDIRNRQTGDVERKPVGGVFVMIGAAPNTNWIADLIDVDERGFVLTGEDAGQDTPFATSMPGIFAVGDVRKGSIKRVASGVGEGSVVISHVWAHVNGGDAP